MEFPPPPVPERLPPAPPPPVPSDRFPTLQDATLQDATLPDATLPDATADQPESAIVRGRRTRWLWSESTFQSVRHHLARTALAFVLAVPVGLAVFLVWASARSAFDDRDYGASIAHSLVQYAFVLVLFTVAATPAAYVLLRDGPRRAVEFVRGRRSTRILLVIYVAFPLTAALVTFVVGHLLIVLLVLLALLILLMITGGF